MSFFHKNKPEGEANSPAVQEWEKNLADAQAREARGESHPEQVAGRLIGRDRIGTDRVSSPETEATGQQPQPQSNEIAVTTGAHGEIVETHEVTEAEAAAAKNKKGKR